MLLAHVDSQNLLKKSWQSWIILNSVRSQKGKIPAKSLRQRKVKSLSKTRLKRNQKAAGSKTDDDSEIISVENTHRVQNLLVRRQHVS